MGVVSVAICSPPQKWGSRPFRSGVSQWWWPSLLRFAPLFSLFFLFPFFFLLFVVVSFFHSFSLSLFLSLSFSLSLSLSITLSLSLTHSISLSFYTHIFHSTLFRVLLTIRRFCKLDVDSSLPPLKWDDHSLGRTNGRLMNATQRSEAVMSRPLLNRTKNWSDSL